MFMQTQHFKIIISVWSIHLHNLIHWSAEKMSVKQCIYYLCMHNIGEGMATHCSTLAWKVPWTEEPGWLQSMGSLESDTTERLPFHFSLSCIGEGNGNPLQCSCLENPRDGGAWWAAVSGVAQSWTWLKRLSSSMHNICSKSKENS